MVGRTRNGTKKNCPVHVGEMASEQQWMTLLCEVGESADESGALRGVSAGGVCEGGACSEGSVYSVAVACYAVTVGS